MASVDDRIVRMEFDNAAFERKLGTTLTSLSKLEKALKFEGAKKGISDISTAAGKFNFGAMGESIEGISRKFLALSTVAITALANITTHAMTAGAQLAKSFTLDPILEGFREYETQLNSVQTILANTASKGTTLDQVNDALQKLNEYSDQTIYNFGQMARNIGTFTAAGVDLDTSVQSIKGIANLAAMSGSSSEQASTAMYQLSQAIATGSLKLMDWNSVVNAGMGGEAFKTALFETGKAMGTLTDVPVSQTFKEWEDSGHNFRESLQDGWITADVLTTTLAGFTGDLTEEMLIAEGYSQAVATNIVKTAAMAKAAATEVKTFTQLVGTVKEAVGTGWADSFKIIVGNFTEAKELWTGVNNSIGAFVGKNADARNALLQGWKDLGGRTLLIQSLKDAFANLGAVLKPIAEAFREVFPPMTAQRLFDLTKRFSEFVAAMKPSEAVINNIKRIFKGLFSILSIGWTIIKQGVAFIGRLVGSIVGLGGGPLLGLVANFGDLLSKLQEFLVTGKGIENFFSALEGYIRAPIPFIIDLKDSLVDLFTGADVGSVADSVGDSLGRLGDRFESVTSIFNRGGGGGGDMFAKLKERLNSILETLGNVWDAISNWFSMLGQKIADVLGEGSFDKVLDVINTGLLGAIATAIALFIRRGFSFNFDVGSGLLDRIGQSFEQLTGVLSAMQADLRANVLLKIAGAIAILTASVLVLSMIDSVALTKALAAMSVGFAQLMASFAIISRISAGPRQAAGLSLLAVGMTLLAGAILILSVAARNLASLDWNELARGLAGVTALMAIMTAAAIILSKNTGPLLRSAVAMIGIAFAISMLAGAVKIFSLMSWDEMGRGLAGLAASLILLIAAIKLIPTNLMWQGFGLMAFAAGLNIMATAVMRFANLNWSQMGQGFVGIAVGLLLVSEAMKRMPKNMPLLGVGFLLISVGLIAIAQAMTMMAALSWGEMLKGLVGIGAALLILTIAMNAMSSGMMGAVTLVAIAGALFVLLAVIKGFSMISWGDLLRGLAGIAIVLTVLGLAAFLLQPLLPALLLLGLALTLIGAGFALFGLGAMMVAKAFEALAKAGEAGAEALVGALESIGRALPALARGFAEGLIELALVLAEGAPKIADAVMKMIESLLDKLITIIPKIGIVVGLMISTFLGLIREKYPEFVATGFGMLIAFLEGLRENIGEITTLVIEIIVEFLNAMAENLDDIITAGLDLLLAFISGIVDNVVHIVDAVTEIITTFVEELAENYVDLITAGTDALVAFLGGITDNLFKIADAVVDIIEEFTAQVAANAWRITTAGASMVIALATALTSNAVRIANAATALVIKFCNQIGNNANRVVTAAANMIISFVTGIGNNASRVVTAGVTTVIKFINGLGQNAVRLANAAADVVIKFLNGLSDAIERKAPQIRAAGRRLVGAIIEGMVGGIASGAGSVINSIVGMAGNAIDAAMGALGINSPSMVFYGIGESIAEGLVLAIDRDQSVENSAVGMVDRATDVFRDSLYKITDSLGTIDEFNPTITPVLDLTRVAEDAKLISGYIQTSEKLSPSYSYSQARTIAADANAQQEDVISAPAGSGEVKFEQNIYSPTQLSTSDIYKQTRNQITMAKEELSIP